VTDQPVHPEVSPGDAAPLPRDVAAEIPTYAATPSVTGDPTAAAAVPALDNPSPVDVKPAAAVTPTAAGVPVEDEAAFERRLSALVDQRLQQIQAGAPLDPGAGEPAKPRPHLVVGDVVAYEHTDTWTSHTSTGHGLLVEIEPANDETGVDEQLLVVPLPSPLRIGYDQLQTD
jgi:hypothetical protein